MTTATRQMLWRRGWSPDRVCVATNTLLELLQNLPPDQREQEEYVLASELARWLRFGVNTDIDSVVKMLGRCHPGSPNTPYWNSPEAVFEILEEGGPTQRVLACIKAECTDPARELIRYLDELAPRRPQQHDPIALGKHEVKITGTHRMALELLICIGTKKALAYVLSRLDLFDWDYVEELQSIVLPHADAILATALDTWKTLSWCARGEVVAFCSAYKLPGKGLADLLIDDSDFDQIAPADCEAYLDTLGNTRDARMIPRLESALKRATAAFIASRSLDSKRWVYAALCALHDVGGTLTSKRIARLARVGIDADRISSRFDR